MVYNMVYNIGYRELFVCVYMCEYVYGYIYDFQCLPQSRQVTKMVAGSSAERVWSS